MPPDDDDPGTVRRHRQLVAELRRLTFQLHVISGLLALIAGLLVGLVLW